jgi:hypothetical protein
MAPQASEKMESATGNGARNERRRSGVRLRPAGRFKIRSSVIMDIFGSAAQRTATPSASRGCAVLNAAICLQPYFQFPLATAAVLAARESLAIGP